MNTMIQKIRSYLLDNEDHKDSIGWLVVIIMLVPSIGMIFQYRKNISTYVGSVNNKKIEKSIFNIKLFEQSKLMENIVKMFGEEQAQYFFDMLFQGKSLEQYVLSGEIRRAFLQQLFSKLISSDYIAGEYILKNFENKSLEKIKQAVGELPFLLITGQVKPNALGSLNVDIKKIDKYCEEVFQVLLLNNLLLVPLTILEKSILNNFPSLPIKINFIVYSYSLKQNEYRKNIDSTVITDNEMRSTYDLEINKFLKRRNLNCSIINYEMKKEHKGKKIEDLWKELSSECKNDINLIIKSLDENFVKKNSNNNLKMHFNQNDLANDDIFASVNLSNKLKKDIIDFVLINNKVIDADASKFIVLEDNGCLYLVKDFSLGRKEYHSFDDVKKSVVDLILTKREMQLLNVDVQKMRYALEEKQIVNNIAWKKEEKVFSNAKIEGDFNKDKAFNDLVLKKLSSGGLRQGNTFVENIDDVYSIYYVSDLTYDPSDTFVVRKDQFYNKEVFVVSREHHAKIEIND